MKKTKEESDLTRQAILDAAMVVFSKKGYSQTTLVEVAKEAEMTRGAIYWHFKDKKELFLMLIQDGFKSTLDKVDAVFHSEKDPLQKVHGFICSILSIMQSMPPLRALDEVIMFHTEWKEKLEDVYNYYFEVVNNMKGQLESTLSEAIESGQISDNYDLSAYTLSVLSYIGGIKSSWLLDLSLESHKPETLADIFINGLKNRS